MLLEDTGKIASSNKPDCKIFLKPPKLGHLMCENDIKPHEEKDL